MDTPLTLLRHFIWRATAKLRHTTVLYGAMYKNRAISSRFIESLIRALAYTQLRKKLTLPLIIHIISQLLSPIEVGFPMNNWGDKAAGRRLCHFDYGIP